MHWNSQGIETKERHPTLFVPRSSNVLNNILTQTLKICKFKYINPKWWNWRQSTSKYLNFAVFLAQNCCALKLPLKILSPFTMFLFLFWISLPAKFCSGSKWLNLGLVTTHIDSENHGRGRAMMSGICTLNYGFICNKQLILLIDIFLVLSIPYSSQQFWGFWEDWGIFLLQWTYFCTVII